MLAGASDPTRLEPAATYALIVGVLEWEHGLTPYPKRNRKDRELAELLLRRGTPSENVTLLLDREATLVNVRRAVTESARRSGEGTTLLVYYAGHGMPAGAFDFCFANYELDTRRPAETGWSLRELGETLAREFRGERVLFFADCCYSGGLDLAVERLAAAGIEAANLTSASRANASTSNWTFTQALLDGLGGEPLLDADGDGWIRLGELAGEVAEAMRHLERQRAGFHARGIDAEFVLAPASAPRPASASRTFALGTYVLAPDGEERRVGRIVGAQEGGALVVQFYDYSDKRTRACPPDVLAPSPGQLAPPELDEGVAPDCEVEWRGTWWAAQVLARKDGRFQIHYLGHASSWDEWVGAERIRFPEPPR